MVPMTRSVLAIHFVWMDAPSGHQKADHLKNEARRRACLGGSTVSINTAVFQMCFHSDEPRWKAMQRGDRFLVARFGFHLGEPEWKARYSPPPLAIHLAWMEASSGHQKADQRRILHAAGPASVVASFPSHGWFSNSLPLGRAEMESKESWATISGGQI